MGASPAGRFRLVAFDLVTLDHISFDQLRLLALLFLTTSYHLYSVGHVRD